jgi:murein DD-endopeptidase MepM/ murein hydrolase activator NlpD
MLVCAFLLALATPAYAAFPSEEDRVPAPGLDCIERVRIPDLVNVIDAKWSPDASALAVVRFERRPSSGPGGYLEDEVLEILDMRTQQVRSVGTIEYGRPAWSPSGRYLAYWGYKADFLEVMDRKSGEVVAKLTPSMPDYKWAAGDSLIYIEKATIRAWNGSRIPATLARIGDTKVPHYPESDWNWSGDGSRFTLTQYDQKDPTPERFIGTTESGDAEPLDLPGALYTEWAPRGSVLLVRYQSRLEVRDLVANTSASIPLARGAIHQWGPDGRTLLVRAPTVTAVAGDAYEKPVVVWPAPAAAPAIVPDLFGVRTFSPDGRYFGGTIRTDRHDNIFAVFRCYEIVRAATNTAPVAFDARQAKIDGGTGRLIRPVAGPIAQFVHAAHSGVDVAAPFGSPIVAADAGTVTKTGWQDDGEGGIRVCLQHAAGLETCYYHVSTILVTVGQRVARGEGIALVGMSGRTNGPHVHWEAKLNGRIIDPLLR